MLVFNAILFVAQIGAKNNIAAADAVVGKIAFRTVVAMFKIYCLVAAITVKTLIAVFAVLHRETIDTIFGIKDFAAKITILNIADVKAEIGIFGLPSLVAVIAVFKHGGVGGLAGNNL